MLCLVALASATVYESMYGTDRALREFYHSRAFETLLALLAVNVLAAMIARFPFSKRQIGFVLTHLAILITLGGALITNQYGVDGQVGIRQGETVSEFSGNQETLVLLNRRNNERHVLELSADIFGGFEAASSAQLASDQFDTLGITVDQYLPDSKITQEVANGESGGQVAVELSVGAGGGASTWLFADQATVINGMKVGFRKIQSLDDVQNAANATDSEGDDGIVRITYKEQTYDLPLRDCLASDVPIADTGYSVRVLRYLPHATVGPDNSLVNLSDDKVNPAIEAVVAGPEGREKRLAFSKFPDFSSMHKPTKIEGVTVTFVAPAQDAPAPPPVEILTTPDSAMFVRFANAAPESAIHKIAVDQILDVPSSNVRLTLLRRFEHARRERIAAPISPRAKNRDSAVHVQLASGKRSSGVWLQKYHPRTVTLGDDSYQLIYATKQVPLGFGLTLDKFRIGHYPGGGMPRTFESTVTINDALHPGQQTRIISMNRPTSYAGWTLYQSSYRLDGDKPISYLSVARDPGQWVVFAGYGMMVLGMCWVLAIRIADHRRSLQVHSASADETHASRDNLPTTGNDSHDGSRAARRKRRRKQHGTNQGVKSPEEVSRH